MAAVSSYSMRCSSPREPDLAPAFPNWYGRVPAKPVYVNLAKVVHYFGEFTC